MATDHKFIGVRMRNSALRTGLFAGLFISVIFIAWLLIANRVPQWQGYALLRNVCTYAAIGVLMAVPVLRFLRQPVTMFVSGVTAWLVLTLIYTTMELDFSRLADRMGALHLFMMGAVCYGFLAVFAWVFHLCAEARHRSVDRSAIPAVQPPRRVS